MGNVVKVTSKRMVTIPARIMKRYGIREGMRVEFVETEAGPLMIPIFDIDELYGIEKGRREALIEAVRELEAEHKKEAGK